jgi:hypothetical protein
MKRNKIGFIRRLEHLNKGVAKRIFIRKSEIPAEK